GEAATVYEIAPRPESASLFQRFPDLLLVQEDRTHLVRHEDSERPEPLQIVVCSRGIAVQGTLFVSTPEEIIVIEKQGTLEAAYELRVEGEKFHFSFDPTQVASRLERWFRFLFNDFLPLAPSVLERDSPDVGARLRARGASPCPECGRSILLR